jgi:hypothetical protein
METNRFSKTAYSEEPHSESERILQDSQSPNYAGDVLLLIPPKTTYRILFNIFGISKKIPFIGTNIRPFIQDLNPLYVVPLDDQRCKALRRRSLNYWDF